MNEKKKEDVPVSSGDTGLTRPSVETTIRSLPGRQCREFAMWCAMRVRHLTPETTLAAALDATARYLRGEATDAEMTTASDSFRALHSAIQTTLYAVIGNADGIPGSEVDEKWVAVKAAERQISAVIWGARARGVSEDEACAAEVAAQRAELERMLGEAKP
jgi:hypothetical protein